MSSGVETEETSSQTTNSSSVPVNPMIPTESVVITNLKLTGSNYLTWSRAMEMIITGKGKENYIIGDEVVPLATDPRYRMWKVENSMVMSWLIGSMAPEIAENFILYQTAKEIWSAAMDMYSKHDNTAELYELEAKLHDIRQGEYTVGEYFSQLKRVWQQIDLYEVHVWPSPEAGQLYRQIVETKRIFRFLAGLNKNLDAVRGRILGTKPLPTLNSVFSEVRHEESRLKVMVGNLHSNLLDSSALITGIPVSTQNSSTNTSSHPILEGPGAHLVRGTGRGRGRFGYAGRGYPANSALKSSLYCKFCHKEGHVVDNCWKLARKLANEGSSSPKVHSNNSSSPNSAGNRWANVGSAAAVHGSEEITESKPIQKQLEALLQLMSQQNFSQRNGQPENPQATMAKSALMMDFPL